MNKAPPCYLQNSLWGWRVDLDSSIWVCTVLALGRAQVEKVTKYMSLVITSVDEQECNNRRSLMDSVVFADKVREPYISQRLRGLKQFHQLYDLSMTEARGSWVGAQFWECSVLCGVFTYTSIHGSLMFLQEHEEWKPLISTLWFKHTYLRTWQRNNPILDEISSLQCFWRVQSRCGELAERGKNKINFF